MAHGPWRTSEDFTGAGGPFPTFFGPRGVCMDAVRSTCRGLFFVPSQIQSFTTRESGAKLKTATSNGKKGGKKKEIPNVMPLE